MNAVYEVRGEFAIAGSHVAGPWDLSMQHGSAPTALVARAAEQLPTREPMQVVRLTVDLMRPVPIAPLEIRAEVVREGRKIQLCAVTLLADGKAVVRASVLKIRCQDFASSDAVLNASLDVPVFDQGEAPAAAISKSSPFISGLELRMVKGDARKPGPAACWFRMHRPLVFGETLSPLLRAAVTADFCNGIGAVLDTRHWTFINADLSINLARMPVGEWILLSADTWLGSDGNAIAFGRLGDVQGYFGRAVQSLVVERR
jgi:hypothetical protein